MQGVTRAGDLGEQCAAELLLQRGHRIVARNWRARGGELDLVTLHRGVLHFVEVKTRSSAAMGGVWESITRTKRHRLARAAEAFLLSEAPEHDGCTFSVALVQLGGDEPQIELWEDAFDSPW